MKRLLFVSFVVLFVAGNAFPYVAVLKNGKRIEGSIVAEDAGQIRVRDEDGVEITIRKNQLDLAATASINEEKARMQIAEREKVQAENQPPQRNTVADIARETRSKRTGKSKVWRKEDLKNLPEITVMGSDLSIEEESADSQFFAEQEEIERSWKDAAMEIYQRLLQARQKYESLKKQCDDLSLSAGFATDYMLQQGAPFGSPVIAHAAETCARMEEASEELNLIEQEMLMLEEEARRKSIPPGWVDPLRN